MATAVIIDDYRNRSTVPRVVNYPITKISYSNTETIAQSILPFRVRFTSIVIEGYASSNPPGIGLQVIGFSNWII
jgi:hypothetical protein